MAVALADARRFVDVDESLEASLKSLTGSLVQKQFNRLTWTEKSSDSVEDTKLRALIVSLGVYAEDPTILDGAFKLFSDYKEDPTSVASELRSIVFGAAVKHRQGDAFTYLLDLEESTSNVDLKLDIVSALTYSKDPSEIKIMLARLKDSDKVRPQDIIRWLAYLMRNRRSRQSAWDWMRDNWAWLKKTFGGDKSYDYFPRYAANSFSTRVMLEEYKAFFNPMLDDLAIARNITMGIEELTNRVSWLEKDLEVVRNYFKQRSI